jgi:uncharacterized protein (DUF4415 family)
MATDWMAEDDADVLWPAITTRPVEEAVLPVDPALPAAPVASPARVGRPRGSVTSDRRQVALRIPQKILDHFRAGGPGWQTRMIAVLQREVDLREASSSSPQ